MENKKRGILTVEAAIVLPIFIMVMVFVLSMLKLCYFHLVMQQALQNVGLTLAQYGYVIDEVVVGGLETFTLQKQTKEAETEIATGVNKTIATGQDLIRLVEGGIRLDTIGEIITKGKEFKTDAEGLVNAVKQVDRTEVINYLLVSAMNGVAGEFVQWMIGDYLTAMEAKSETFQNLEYELYIETETKDILLIVEYDYVFDFFFTKPMRFQQMVRVHPWVGGSTEGVY